MKRVDWWPQVSKPPCEGLGPARSGCLQQPEVDDNVLTDVASRTVVCFPPSLGLAIAHLPSCSRVRAQILIASHASTTATKLSQVGTSAATALAATFVATSSPATRAPCTAQVHSEGHGFTRLMSKFERAYTCSQPRARVTLSGGSPVIL